MPTATTTIIKSRTTSLPLKAGSLPSVTSGSILMAQTSKAAALHSLYNRATRAFIHRDIALTYSLLQSAFTLLNPPNVVPDSLSDHRRKWDILRITLESTVYTSPPSSPESLPETLRTNLIESPQALATSIYSRSLALFTPSNGLSKTALSAAYLPYQVLSTLVYCTIKIDAPDVGRVVIEDWLARREPHYSLDPPEELEGDGYEKTLELYTLLILPKLEQWDYAREFLEYESELTSQRREYLRTSLNSLYTQAMAARRPFKAVPLLTPASMSPRSCSPSPSCSSSSSSLSNTSTHTVVPSTRRAHNPSALTSLNQSFPSSSSFSSSGTVTPREPHTNPVPNGNHRPHSNSKSRTLSTTSSTYSSLPRSSSSHQATSVANLNTYALIRASLAPYVTSKRMSTFLVLFLLIPVLSFILRMRRKRLMNLAGATQMTASGSAAASYADLVRKRLQAAGGGVEGSLVRKAWGEIVRVVLDTVRMASSGLV